MAELQGLLKTLFNPLGATLLLISAGGVFALWLVVGRIPKQERSSDQKHPRSAWFDNP